MTDRHSTIERALGFFRLAAFGLAVVALALAGALAGSGAQVAAQSSQDTDEQSTEVLRVATKSLPPFVFIDGEGQEPRGFSVDYWNLVAERLGVQTEWVVQDTVSDIIESVERGEVDAAIAGISITREREEVIDFSQPYYVSGQQIVATASGASTFRTLGNLIGSGTFLLPLMALIMLVIIVSHLVWWFERGHESDDFPQSYRKGIGEALWWSTVSVITGGEAVKNINTALSRLIAIFWMLVGLFLLAFVTARATSVLTVAELEAGIDGIEDLAGRDVGTVQGTASVPFIQEEIGVLPSEYPTLTEALDALVSGNIEAVIFDAPVVAYAISSEGYGNDLILIEPVEGRDPYGVALPSGSERLEQVNAAVIEIGRDGTLDDLVSEWFGTG
ncbi:MAG: transporter substrate-binding domain-containing protein [Acidimicrobiales bacterium]